MQPFWTHGIHVRYMLLLYAFCYVTDFTIAIGTDCYIDIISSYYCGHWSKCVMSESHDIKIIAFVYLSPWQVW